MLKRSRTTSNVSDQKRTKLIPIPSAGFIRDSDGFVHVYIDGSCLGNGKAGASAGYGVFFGYNHSLNASEPVAGRSTNNTAEIAAATCAIKKAREAGIEKLRIFSDSMFMINAMTSWIEKWKKNGWRTATGRKVINRKDFEELDKEIGQTVIEWNHVSAHTGIEGNEQADRLAKLGASRACVTST